MNKNLTKKLLVLSAFALLGGAVQSQAQTTSSLAEDGQNLVKVNVTALAFKNFSFQYERAIGKQISVVMGAQFRSKSSPPFKGAIKDLVDDQETKNTIDRFKISPFALTPEVRFYMGQGVFRGFYVAPFLRYSRNGIDLPIDYDAPTSPTTTIRKTLVFKGDVNSYMGGVLIGAQWKLSKLVYLDWWILGPSYGIMRGGISAKGSLSADEQHEVRQQSSDIVDDLPLVKGTSIVDANGADINFKGPSAGLRAGINVGFRF